MAIDGVVALGFDVFGTVVDWRGSIIREGQQVWRARGLEIDWAQFADDWRAGIAGTDVVIIATRWPDYAEVTDLAVPGQVVFDARRMLDPAAVSADYLTIGRRMSDEAREGTG